MRIAIRGWADGVLQFDERHDVAAEEDLTEMAEQHASRLLAAGEVHMIEIEFLDEPDPLQRFVRFGTDPRRMVAPISIGIDGGHGAN